MTAASDQLAPHLEAAALAAAGAMAFTAVRAGNLVSVDDPGPSLPDGGVRLMRATVGGVGLDVVIALTDGAIAAACETAGTDNPATALGPAFVAAIESLGEQSCLPLPMIDLEEMGVGLPWGPPGFEAATAGLFEGEDQLGNVVFLFSPDGPAAVAGPGTADIAVASFPDAGGHAELASGPEPLNPLSMLRGVEMRVTAELGRTRLPVSHLLDLGPGSVVELDRVAGTPVDVVVNGTIIARGEVVVIDEEYGVRITEIVGAEEAR